MDWLDLVAGPVMFLLLGLAIAIVCCSSIRKVQGWRKGIFLFLLMVGVLLACVSGVATAKKFQKIREATPSAPVGQTSECRIDWDGLTVVGHFGGIEVQNKTDSATEVWVYGESASLQASMEPGCGIRLRSGAKMGEKVAPWKVKRVSGETRDFDFGTCPLMPFETAPGKSEP